MRTAKRILAEFMTVVMVLQACSPTVAAVAAGWQNISSEIAAASAEASDAAENGETKSDAVTGSGSSDAGADSDGAGDDAAKDDAASGDTAGGATGSDSTGDQTENDNTAGATGDDAGQDADATASDETAVQANATITDLSELVELLSDNGAENIVLKSDNSGIESFDVTLSPALAVLSNANAEFYQDAQIKINLTGDADLTLPAKNGMSFQGLGSNTMPFEGSISSTKSGDGSVELTTDRTVFNNLRLTGQNNTVKIKWVGATTYSAPMIASKIIGEGRELNAAVNIANPSGTNETIPSAAPALTAPLLGEATGELTANVTYSLTGDRKGLNVDAVGNIGLLANTVKDGTFTVKSVKFPEDLVGNGAVKTSTGNAGLLVGAVEDGATLNVGTRDKVPAATVQSTNGCAGGVVGLVGSSAGATVNVTETLDLQTLTVKGTIASGGLIGKATKLTLGADNKQVTCPKNIGDATSKASGGFIGYASFAASVEFAGNNQIDTGDGVTLAGATHVKDAADGVGSVFGVLTLDDSDVSVSFKGGSFKSAFGGDASNAAFGGLIGFVSGAANSTDEKSSLSLLKVEGVTTEFSLARSPYFAGGIIGWLGLGNPVMPAALEIENATIKCTQVASTSNGFGGAVGCIDKNSIADVNGITVSNEGSIAKGAGVAAECWAATIRLGGVTDFSNMHFNAGDATAQIAMVRADEPSLVFARGTGSDDKPANSGNKDYWIYERCKDAPKIDDLGGAQDASKGYGEVVRLDGSKLKSDLIQLNETTHKPEGPSSTDWSWQVGYTNGTDSDKWNQDHTLDIDDEQDFVALALSIQTGGLYNGVFGPTSNMTDLLGSQTVINLNCDVDLSGTGIGGLGLDSQGSGVSFSGTFNGENHKVTLAIGEPYGMRDGKQLAAGDTSEGNGKIYRHGRLGLFNSISGATKVNNLTVAGFMKLDNGISVDAGSLTATIADAANKKLLLSGVTCETNITCDDTFGNNANIGGIAGSVSAAATVDFNNGAKAKTTIVTGKTLNGNTRIGGAIGYVGDVASTFNVASLEVGGSINTGDCADGRIAQVGGLIGGIAQSTYNEKKIVSSAVKNVNITGLAYDSFNMVVGKNGDKLNGAGGLLGYSWGNAIVTIGGAAANANDSTYALKTANNTTITANSSTEVGGLVYAASGYWIINDYAIDLSGVTINADKATVLGLLVGRGSRTENSTTYGAETYSGLYLENKASWDTAYKINGAAAGNGVKINNTAIKSNDSATSFDEWVGNSTRPDSINEAGVKKTGSKLIDGEWNVVVSLHTKDDINGGKLDMSGNPGNDNSYHNRSDFGKDHNTNARTRYYYNLDKAYAKVGSKPENASKNSWMNSAEYLLLWCAYLYAPSAIRSYIIPGNQAIFQGNNIGTSDSTGVAINLDGYSFYPTNPASGSTVTVNNVTITFHYSDIKAEQEGNKKNSEATQHENMHCALIRTHTGNLKVKNVTLAGTVGSVVNDAGSSSGALVCRYIYGPINKTNVAQLEIDGLTLDGLTVDGVNGNTSYAPLLINEMQTCVNLSAKNISTRGYTNGATAATSLFGRLGVGKNADQVTATFNRISVPSATGQNATDKSIFTRASLLESFGYGEGKTGSAVYTFMNDDQAKDRVTLGKEIDSTGGEYPGKQLWYYDEKTYGTDEGLVKVKDNPADAERPWFGDYLPYVAKGKATANGVQYHEIKVNQRIPNFTTGCGTYGDPYTIASASELNAAANYINNGTALDGWEVTIARDQSTLCQRRNGGGTENEVTYVYKQTNDATKKWEKKTADATDPNDVLSDDTMRRYLQSAYYSIEPKSGTNNTIELDGSAFAGFGTSAYPFRGVIVGDLGGAAATIVIKNNTGSLRGLIPYSYGSVVRNLNITYSDATASITYAPKNSDGVPGAFFGGVIGCIMGGDNIIDDVTVSSDHFVVAGAKGDKGGAHLVPVGGYVGAIAGGGVIFRNMNENSSWRAGTSDKSRGLGKGNFDLYDNPYVGRVIDGYAFSEGCTVDNGDANYKINELIEPNAFNTNCIETDAIKGRYRDYGSNKTAVTTKVNNAQGLLVLSAIISSGAAGGSANTSAASDGYGTYAGSRAYLGGNNAEGTYQFGNQQYGKVRNASYASVGKPESANGDFAVAINDDTKSPGIQSKGNSLDYAGNRSDVNSPYLVKKYATWQTGYICAAQVSGMDLQFADNAEFVMTDYGSGFTGLSGRYYSNACASGKGADRDRIVPLVACINGNGATIKVKNNTQEYTDDDFCVAGVGGLFNTVTFYSSKFNSDSVKKNDDANVRNISFEGCDISLSYITTTGTKQSTSGSNGKSGWVGTGCLAGSTANQGGSDGVAYGVFKNVRISDSAVSGGCMAGGLIGSAGLMKRSTDGSNGSIVNYGGMSSPVQLYDCSYSGITVSARSNAGGFVGYINSGACGVWVSNDKTVADNSTISIIEKAGDKPDLYCTAGGIFGLTGGALSVNTGQGDGASQVATISDVSLIVNHNALGVGGIAGRTVTYQSNINRVKVMSTKKASEKTPPYFGSLEAVSDTGNTHAVNAGGIIGLMNNSVALDFCTVENLHMGVTEHAGGLVGAADIGKTLNVTNATVDGVQFDGARCGGILGNCQDQGRENQGGTNVVVANATVKNCSFGTLNSKWTHGDGDLRNHSGGIVGAASGTIKIANVLISKNDFKQPGGQGFLVGDTAQLSSNFKGLYAAGVDIVLKGDADKSAGQKPIKYFNDGAIADVNKKSYIAFGDYEDTLSVDKNATLYGNDAATGNVTAAVSPCVTTSPKSGLAVRASDADTTDRYLFGDGMKVDLATTIQSQAGKNVVDRYTYTNIGGIDDNGAYQNTSTYDAISVASTFNENNEKDNQATTKFPVLVISGTDNTTVTSYLNIITNGGFSDACRLNGTDITKAHVTAKAEVFQLKNGVFVRDEDASKNPTLRVVNNGKNNMSFSPGSDWDNGKGRFTLLTVTFTEAGQSYNVQVPIIVKRKLEIDFAATYDYGTNFKESDYANLGNGAHVLTSFGEPMTGLLTWTYNSANGTEVDFGWDSYMAAGGSMKGLGKSISFEGSKGKLPQGTQLTLVDANVDGKAGSKEYHYEVGEGGATSVSLSGDAGFKDSAGNPYQERWLSEILGVSAKQDNDGAWVVCDNEKDATAKAKLDGEWKLFKVASGSGADHYTLTVPKDDGKEQRSSESVYLVVNVPGPVDGTGSINGYTGTSVSSGSSGDRVSVNLHRVLRPNGGKETDIQNNTASTYSILSNYGQKVVDNESEARTLVSQSGDGAAYVLSLDVTDEIAFSASQNYAEGDSLFYRLDTSLCKYDASNALTGVSSFPSGTSAIAKFYVAIGGQSYTWKNGRWQTCNASTPAYTQTVADTGDDSLKLTLDHDLAGIRAFATSGSFTVRTVVEEIRLTPDGCSDVIALSKRHGEDACTKMSYIAKLSTRKSGLATSSMAETTRGNVGYYRMDKGDTTITLSAPDKSQLGINVDDLRPIADGTIGLGATYELGRLSNAAEAIASANSVAYTLKLQRRNGIDGSYVDVTGNISDYVTVTESRLATVSVAGNAIAFTDLRGGDGKFKTQNGDATTFSLPFTVKVNTQVELRNQFYANYRLVMTASLVTNGAESATPQSPDYVTYTLTRVNINGIDHGSETN